MTRFRLSTQVLLLALLNFFLLAALFLALGGVRLRGAWTDVVLDPARDRLMSLGRLIALEAMEAPRGKQEEILATYSEKYSVQFYLFENNGEKLGGPPVELPAKVFARLTERPPSGRGDRPPPPGRDDRPPPRGLGVPDPRNGIFLFKENDSYWLGIRVPARNRDGEETRATLILNSPSILGRGLFFDWGTWSRIFLGVLSITAICWIPFTRSLTRQIAALKVATEQIAEGKFDVSANSNRRDELGELGASINLLAHKLSEFVTGQKRFLGGIAHELASPIARTQWAIGILERELPDAKREELADLNDEVQHMARLVNELLVFSKAGIEGLRRPLVDVDIAAVVERAVRREVVDGEDVRLTGSNGILARADEEYLAWAVGNLIRNALRYAGKAGPVEVSWGREGKTVAIRVGDHGPGLPESEVEKVFAPFYRLDAARTREAGGAGLGLAIVKSSIEACRGTVTIQNRQPHGLLVEIRLEALVGGSQ